MTNTQDLIALIQRFSSLKVVVAGDIMLDSYIMGSVERISPEAPVPVLLAKNNKQVLGGAGNAIANIASLGATALPSCLIGDDNYGKIVREMLNGLKADTSVLTIDPHRKTTVKERITTNTQQIVRVDYEDTFDIAGETSQVFINSTISAIKQADAFLISDYAKGAITEDLFIRLKELSETGEFGLNKKPFIIDPKEKHFSIYRYASSIKPNKGEAERASGKTITDYQSGFEVARFLQQKWNAQSILITLGELGMISYVKETDTQLCLPSYKKEVRDVSGAGDTVSAIYTLTLAAGGTVEQAMELANIGASVVVSKFGTATITADELMQATLLLADLDS